MEDIFFRTFNLTGGVLHRYSIAGIDLHTPVAGMSIGINFRLTELGRKHLGKRYPNFFN